MRDHLQRMADFLDVIEGNHPGPCIATSYAIMNFRNEIAQAAVQSQRLDEERSQALSLVKAPKPVQSLLF